MRDIAVGVHLRLFSLRRRWERGHPEDARADPLCHRFDRPALTGTVSAFKHDADLQTFVDYPLLELHELDVQLRELMLILPSLEFLTGFKIMILLVGHVIPPEHSRRFGQRWALW